MQDQDSNNEITNTIISINVHLQQAKQKLLGKKKTKTDFFPKSDQW